ncbi:Sugar phosphatase YidA [Corynebacterium kalinowskii]|uniref:Sugar phosphatase YidA n=1 Tax=Corynebacterium kalinowskii TaxID=2675216 RepID=A0A6B8W010_9CORY|nr:Sugar phosphatase YidA [Corynebacterium kalinowskii]
MIGEPPLLIASDVDGTLIDDRERIPTVVRAAVRRAITAGTVFALSTGRPPRWIHPVLSQLALKPVCVCANGAIVYDAATDTMLDVQNLAPEALRAVADIAEEVLAPHGGAGFAVERAGESAWAPENELFLVSPNYVPAWFSEDNGMVPLDELIAQPAIKLLVRNEHLTSAQIFDLVAPRIPADLAHVTFSVPDGLIEVAAPGVTKARGVQFLASRIGAGPGDVVAFGDMPNDIEMLQWAGLGVAMANARPEVKAAADEVTLSNNEGGIAAVLERWF